MMNKLQLPVVGLMFAFTSVVQADGGNSDISQVITLNYKTGEQIVVDSLIYGCTSSDEKRSGYLYTKGGFLMTRFRIEIENPEIPAIKNIFDRTLKAKVSDLDFTSGEIMLGIVFQKLALESFCMPKPSSEQQEDLKIYRAPFRKVSNRDVQRVSF